jgi:CubicO group peptidase (beta-lactamase class C family)
MALLCQLLPAIADNRAFPRASAAMQRAIARKEVAGVVTLVVNRERVLHMGMDGYADVARKRPFTPDSLFWIASMTKPVTGTAILMLQDEGKLDTGDLVEKYLPEFAGLKTPLGMPAHLMIQQIMTHTSGLGEASGPAAQQARTLADLVPIWISAPMQYEPGT